MTGPSGYARDRKSEQKSQHLLTAQISAWLPPSSVVRANSVVGRLVSGKRMRVRVDICVRQRLFSIPQQHRPLRQASEAIYSAILLAECHRQHPGHDDLDAAKVLRLLFRRRLVHHDSVDALLLIERDESAEIFAKIAGQGRGHERAKGLLEGL